MSICAPTRGLAVHPRARGEHSRTSNEPNFPAGSSPRTRGTRCTAPADRPRRRFIPAHAGNTRTEHFDRAAWTVHPRARGEHQVVQGVLWCVTRFIPAHAGNTSTSALPTATLLVHPRARGEHAGLRHCSVFTHRFIPAHAGNTSRATWAVRRNAVHPRARGEHAVPQELPEITDGSSPRTRGTP